MEEYEEVRRVGKGSEGSVYLVRHLRSDALFVIKKIFSKNASPLTANEVRILAQVSLRRVYFEICTLAGHHCRVEFLPLSFLLFVAP
eukprot:m.586411 g.586411  ORF g.586411 m.586411 type:complete len:87 (+) comp57977_c0_seq7:158-418(+)